MVYKCFRGTATLSNALVDVDSLQVDFPVATWYDVLINVP